MKNAWIVGLALALAAGLTASTTAARSDFKSPGVIPTIVRKAVPAVVSITTRRIEQDEFNRPFSTRGLGSGFIVDRRGYILTNLHVVENAAEIKVTLNDGRRFAATRLHGLDSQGHLYFAVGSSRLLLRPLSPPLALRHEGALIAK